VKIQMSHPSRWQNILPGQTIRVQVGGRVLVVVIVGPGGIGPKSGGPTMLTFGPVVVAGEAETSSEVVENVLVVTKVTVPEEGRSVVASSVLSALVVSESAALAVAMATAARTARRRVFVVKRSMLTFGVRLYVR
jgi:hypothetical protein